MPAPPYSSDAVTPSTPSAPILGHRSIGNALSRSMAAARGAISSAANASTVARSMSALSPRSKLSPGRRFGRLAIPWSPEFFRYDSITARKVAPRQADAGGVRAAYHDAPAPAARK
jgi:hypothetical protein